MFGSWFEQTKYKKIFLRQSGKLHMNQGWNNFKWLLSIVLMMIMVYTVRKYPNISEIDVKYFMKNSMILDLLHNALY